MTPNMSTIDRIVRLLLAVVCFVLYYNKLVQGTAGFILLAVAIIFVLTSFVNFCPLYRLFGISSKKDDSTAA